MKIKLGNKIYSSEIEALMLVLSREELNDLIDSSSEGTMEIRYLKYPEEKYNEVQIEQFRILPDEVFNKPEKVISEVELFQEGEVVLEKIETEIETETETETEEEENETPINSDDALASEGIPEENTDKLEEEDFQHATPEEVETEETEVEIGE